MPTSLLAPRTVLSATLARGLMAFSLLALAGCGNGGVNAPPLLGPTPPGTPTPPAPPAAAPTAFTPAGAVSQSATLTLEQQDGSTTAGAQVSTSPNHTLISEGASP